MLKDILTPQKLKSELEHSNLSQIAKRYGVSKQYMTQVFAEYRKQYPHLFPETYPSKEWLENALKQKTILGICNETGLSYHRIRKLMDEYGFTKTLSPPDLTSRKSVSSMSCIDGPTRKSRRNTAAPSILLRNSATTIRF